MSGVQRLTPMTEHRSSVLVSPLLWLGGLFVVVVIVCAAFVPLVTCPSCEGYSGVRYYVSLEDIGSCNYCEGYWRVSVLKYFRRASSK